ncbi:MAG TPA: OsmC family protein [Gemmatimonadales bacterium]|jgi:organic hydroperoxide reductase OsmC/OhrA|nr:OsmC family protein [Gemmatimonadales bacterium]
MTEETGFEVILTRERGMQFGVEFAGLGLPPLTVDESPPVGGGAGPNPARLLAAAVGHCLSASLLFCLAKARIPVVAFRTAVKGTLARNERGRWRITALSVRVEPTVAELDRERAARCLELFEDFCVVTESVRRGIEVAVAVAPRTSGTTAPEAG